MRRGKEWEREREKVGWVRVWIYYIPYHIYATKRNRLPRICATHSFVQVPHPPNPRRHRRRAGNKHAGTERICALALHVCPTVSLWPDRRYLLYALCARAHMNNVWLVSVVGGLCAVSYIYRYTACLVYVIPWAQGSSLSVCVAHTHILGQKIVRVACAAHGNTARQCHSVDFQCVRESELEYAPYR